MKPSPRISVVMATYNQASTLPEALESLKAQTLPASEIEIIVVNDGSTDETAQILRRHAAGLRLIETEHRGLVPSCNEGLALARGEYWARMDSDDRVDPDWLKELVHALEQNPAACCVVPDRYEISRTQRRRIRIAPENLYTLVACGTLFQTAALRRIGGFRPLFWEEYDLYLRLKPLGEFLHLPKPLYTYRRHPGGMTHSSVSRRAGWQELGKVWGGEALRAAGLHPELRAGFTTSREPRCQRQEARSKERRGRRALCGTSRRSDARDGLLPPQPGGLAASASPRGVAFARGSETTPPAGCVARRRRRAATSPPPRALRGWHLRPARPREVAKSALMESLHGS